MKKEERIYLVQVHSLGEDWTNLTYDEMELITGLLTKLKVDYRVSIAVFEGKNGKAKDII